MNEYDLLVLSGAVRLDADAKEERRICRAGYWGWAAMWAIAIAVMIYSHLAMPTINAR